MKKAKNKAQNKTKKDAPDKGKIRPLGDRILIKEIGKETGGETKSGIIIPETVSEDKGARKGKVIAVGEGHYHEGKLIPIKVRPGETVLFQWGDLIKIDGEEYHVVSESSVLAVIN